MNIEKIVNTAAELNETHRCGLDSAFVTAALMDVAEKLETFLNGPSCRETIIPVILETKPETQPETKPETKPETQPETKPETKPAAKAVTLDGLRKATHAVVVAGKRDQVVKLLGNHKLLTDLAEADYPDFLRSLEAL